MKINYQETINEAKELGLILQDDKYVLCSVRPREDKFYVTYTEVIYYKFDLIFVINPNEVKLIDVDKKTGKLIGSYKIYPREDIIDLNDYWSFFSRDFYIKAKNPEFRENLIVCKKFHGFDQKDILLDVRNIVTQKYTLPIKEAKKQAKMKK